MKLVLAVALVAALGCKKKDADPVAGSGSSATKVDFTAPKHGPHHEKVGQWLEKFQGVLGDRWHGAKGEARKTDTCTVSPALETEVTALAGLPPPEKIDAGKWSGGTKALAESVGTLKTACAGADLPAFETAFDDMHAKLHDLVTQVGGHTESDGTHPHEAGSGSAK